MENNQMNSNFSEEKYNAFKDGSFWVALVISFLINIKAILISIESASFHPSLIPGLAVALVWIGWIIFKKGKKGSLVVGFLLGLVLGAILMFTVVGPMIDRQASEQRQKAMEEYREQMDLELQQQLDETENK